MCLLRFWFPSSADYTNCINKKEKHFIMTEVFVSVEDHGKYFCPAPFRQGNNLTINAEVGFNHKKEWGYHWYWLEYCTSCTIYLFHLNFFSGSRPLRIPCKLFTLNAGSPLLIAPDMSETSTSHNQPLEDFLYKKASVSTNMSCDQYYYEKQSHINTRTETSPWEQINLISYILLFGFFIMWNWVTLL